jgi:hypothetical protein
LLFFESRSRQTFDPHWVRNLGIYLFSVGFRFRLLRSSRNVLSSRYATRFFVPGLIPVFDCFSRRNFYLRIFEPPKTGPFCPRFSSRNWDEHFRIWDKCCCPQPRPEGSRIQLVLTLDKLFRAPRLSFQIALLAAAPLSGFGPETCDLHGAALSHGRRGCLYTKNAAPISGWARSMALHAQCNAPPSSPLFTFPALPALTAFPALFLPATNPLGSWRRSFLHRT